MTIVAFLQNQWFPAKSVPAIKAAYARHCQTPDDRDDLNARYLFFRCLTGMRLRAAFGELCDEIVWENVSPEIGSESDAKFAADPDHIRAVLAHFKPTVILAFGAMAREAVAAATKIAVIPLPHPAARRATVAKELRDGAALLREIMADGGARLG